METPDQRPKLKRNPMLMIILGYPFVKSLFIFAGFQICIEFIQPHQIGEK